MPIIQVVSVASVISIIAPPAWHDIERGKWLPNSPIEFLGATFALLPAFSLAVFPVPYDQMYPYIANHSTVPLLSYLLLGIAHGVINALHIRKMIRKNVI